MRGGLDDFQSFRADLNEEILGCGHLGIKRFFALDHQAYESGPLGTKTKELLGLVASAVLRCDDCITYHLVRCGEEGWKRDEVIDTDSKIGQLIAKARSTGSTNNEDRVKLTEFHNAVNKLRDALPVEFQDFMK